jgi:GNAT superfamily N-acetyltransferase
VGDPFEEGDGGVAHEALSVTLEDPREPDSAALVSELMDFLTDLYPEDVEDPPSPWTVDDLALRGIFVVARQGSRAAGCGGLAPLAVGGALEIVRMYVRPRFRGRRIAERILVELERRARERGVASLMLRCGPRQPEALRMYERNGYVRRPAFAQHRTHPTNIFYEKQLSL